MIAHQVVGNPGTSDVEDGSAAGSPPAEKSRWYETLTDGSRVLIRPICSDDADLEQRFMERLSPESIEYRFLGQVKPSNTLAAQLADTDLTRDMALVALHYDTENAAHKRELGVARFCTDNDGRRCACAIVVADDWQRRGLGRLLMRHLIEIARGRGIEQMYSIDLASNTGMRRLAEDLGFRRTVTPGCLSEATYTLDLRK